MNNKENRVNRVIRGIPCIRYILSIAFACVLKNGNVKVKPREYCCANQIRLLQYKNVSQRIQEILFSRAVNASRKLLRRSRTFCQFCLPE